MYEVIEVTPGGCAYLYKFFNSQLSKALQREGQRQFVLDVMTVDNSLPPGDILQTASF